MLETITKVLEPAHRQPLSTKFILRFCIVLILLLALTAGYFQVVDETWRAKYDMKIMEKK
jgi:hypothetical protein